MKLSEAQRKWLEHLRDNGPDESCSVTGYFCRKHKLTEFQCRVRETGEVIGTSEAHKRWPGNDTFLHVEYIGDQEAITPAGLKALEETAPPVIGKEENPSHAR